MIESKAIWLDKPDIKTAFVDSLTNRRSIEVFKYFLNWF